MAKEDNEVIFNYIDLLKHITSQKKVKKMVARMFNLTDKEAQEYLWAYAIKD